MEKLDHESSETFERARYSNSRADLDKDSLSGVDVNL